MVDINNTEVMMNSTLYACMSLAQHRNLHYCKYPSTTFSAEKWKLTSLSQPHVLPTLFDFLSSEEHTVKNVLKNISTVLIHLIKFNGVQMFQDSKTT